MEISLTINGKAFEVNAADAQSILTDLNFLKKWSAVEINGDIIHREDLCKTQLKDGDKIEVVSPVGGGALS